MATPIFLLSLPRSGSTLLQRVLATDARIATASEPWLMLPYVAAYSNLATFSEFGGGLAKVGIREFLESLPGGMSNYRECIARFASSVYDLASPTGAIYFLDKTPRYTLIADELIKIFPDAKYVVLWRNPAAIVASMIESFYDGKWRIYSNHIDLFRGFEALHDFAVKYRDRTLFIHYETFVKNPNDTLASLADYLGLNEI
ncbi:MAG: sulfotransferase, partial [Pseudomonadales bacterium]